MKCTYDPTALKGQPIGMLHCPDCGEMVLAGIAHPDYDAIWANLEAYDAKEFDDDPGSQLQPSEARGRQEPDDEVPKGAADANPDLRGKRPRG